jgi:hypothetical protein
MIKEKKHWNNKVAKYSLLASAALTVLNACGKDEEEPNDPDIIETDVVPDIAISSSTNAVDVRVFDLNNDGTSDINIGISNYSGVYGQYVTDFNIAYVEGLNDTELLTQEETFTVAGASFTDTVVSPINEGNTIGASQVIWDDYFAILGLSGLYYNENVSVGQFFGQDKFVGLRIPVAGNLHYAWMRLSLSADGTAITVKEYAFRETPNTPINAGDK